MDTNAKVVGVTSSASVAAVAAAAPTESFDQSRLNRQADQQQSADQARYRLIIEEGPARGTFIYKTLDSVTGEVVRQFPREQVLKMAENGSYAAGGLIDTSA